MAINVTDTHRHRRVTSQMLIPVATQKFFLIPIINSLWMTIFIVPESLFSIILIFIPIWPSGFEFWVECTCSRIFISLWSPLPGFFEQWIMFILDIPVGFSNQYKHPVCIFVVLIQIRVVLLGKKKILFFDLRECSLSINSQYIVRITAHFCVYRDCTPSKCVDSLPCSKLKQKHIHFI